MDRRELLGLLGAGTVGLLATTGAAGQDEHKGHEGHEAQEGHLRTLAECAGVCNQAAHHCLEQLKKGGTDAEHHARAHELTMDCQAFCVLTATLMARSSPLAGYAHTACADACRDCAAECDKGNGSIMKQCAEKCRACEKVCRTMEKAGGEREHAVRH